jgi:hypothetical protein
MLQKELVPQVEPIPGTEHPGISRLSTPILALARPNSDKARGYPKPAAIGCPMPNAAPQTTKSPELENFQGGPPRSSPFSAATRLPEFLTPKQPEPTSIGREPTSIITTHKKLTAHQSSGGRPPGLPQNRHPTLDPRKERQASPPRTTASTGTPANNG